MLEALDVYSTYLAGQGTGMDCSGPLSLPAVESTLRILRHPLEDRPAMTWRLLKIHAGLMDIQRREAKTKGKRG